MSGTLLWPIDDAFKAMVEKATINKEDVRFVKDQGVYLMAFDKDPKKNSVVYAKGLDPNKVAFDDWYDKARSVCGGDDFAENVPTAFLQKLIAKKAKGFRIKLTARSMTMEATL